MGNVGSSNRRAGKHETMAGSKDIIRLLRLIISDVAAGIDTRTAQRKRTQDRTLIAVSSRTVLDPVKVSLMRNAPTQTLNTLLHKTNTDEDMVGKRRIAGATTTRSELKSTDRQRKLSRQRPYSNNSNIRSNYHCKSNQLVPRRLQLRALRKK